MIRAAAAAVALAGRRRRPRFSTLPRNDGPAKQEEKEPPAPQVEIELPPNPGASSCAGPYASRPDRDPWPAAMPCLSRAAGAGIDDAAYAAMSGAFAGGHTPGAHHHSERDGEPDVEDDDRVNPPPRDALEMPADEAAFSYPIERDPCVHGMATRPPAEGVQLPPDP